MADRLRQSGEPRGMKPHSRHDPPTPPPRPNRPVYLDNQATTRCDPRVVAEMLPWFTEHYGNPHSVEHVMGLEAEAAVEDGARPRRGADRRGSHARWCSPPAPPRATTSPSRAPPATRCTPVSERRRIVTVATEHKCVLESVADLADEGFEPVVLPVRRDGLLDPDLLREALARADAAGQRHGGEQRDRRGAGHSCACRDRQARRGRCSIPTRRRRWARSRSM